MLDLVNHRAIAVLREEAPRVKRGVLADVEGLERHIRFVRKRAATERRFAGLTGPGQGDDRILSSRFPENSQQIAFDHAPSVRQAAWIVNAIANLCSRVARTIRTETGNASSLPIPMRLASGKGDLVERRAEHVVPVADTLHE